LSDANISAECSGAFKALFPLFVVCGTKRHLKIGRQLMSCDKNTGLCFCFFSSLSHGANAARAGSFIISQGSLTDSQA